MSRTSIGFKAVWQRHFQLPNYQKPRSMTSLLAVHQFCNINTQEQNCCRFCASPIAATVRFTVFPCFTRFCHTGYRVQQHIKAGSLGIYPLHSSAFEVLARLCFYMLQVEFTSVPQYNTCGKSLRIRSWGAHKCYRRVPRKKIASARISSSRWPAATTRQSLKAKEGEPGPLMTLWSF